MIAVVSLLGILARMSKWRKQVIKFLKFDQISFSLSSSSSNLKVSNFQYLISWSVNFLYKGRENSVSVKGCLRSTKQLGSVVQTEFTR